VSRAACVRRTRKKPQIYKTSLRYPNLSGLPYSNQQEHQAIKMMKAPYGGVILSAAKDLLYSFSIRNSRCFATLSMTAP